MSLQGNVIYDFKQTPGGGGGLIGADNGLSVEFGKAVLGDIGNNAAELTSGRIVPLNGNTLQFLNVLSGDPVISSVGIFTPDPLDITQRGNGATDDSGNGGFFETWTPANYGMTYPSNFMPGDTVTMDKWRMGYVLSTSGDTGGGIHGMPDAVLSFGYNTDFNGGQFTNTDAAWRLGFENHFIGLVGGHTGADFEFHMPEVTVVGNSPALPNVPAGTAFRINSYYVRKDNADCINDRTVSITTFYNWAENIGAQNNPYMTIQRAGSGGNISFFPADSTFQQIGTIDFSGSGVGGVGTRLVSFGFGDFTIENIAEGYTPINCATIGSGNHGNILFNQENTPYPFNSRGSSIFGNVDTFTYSTNAQVAIYSTIRGFLPPQMSTTQKLAIPVVGPTDIGLTVYDTTLNQLSYWNGTTWINV